MYAIETAGLSKAFRNIYAVQNLNLKVPEGSIYGFIGENGSGKSTTEKLICGLLNPSGGEIRLYGKHYTDAGIRARMGVLIENPGCFPGSTVYQNLMMQALNLGIEKPKAEVERVLKLVSMAGAADRKFRQCSLGMKQRLGVAQSLLGRPRLLVLDEPINGLDADGMRIVRETLIELSREEGVTILISSHILGELSKIATHYGIIRNGTLIKELREDEMSEECRDFVFVKTNNDTQAVSVLSQKYREVEQKDGGIRVYDETESANVNGLMYSNGLSVNEISFQKIGLEEYYLRIMSRKGEVA
ncbi:MAG: ATP-binding cassette domain-containing protein [Oscillospiraceae bacterium]|jgi:ABC-2 type transport system ATP-binding protein|nr:ATP-binding cassette domain-containing protein [Oscillospiraceae bacterium]